MVKYYMEALQLTPQQHHMGFWLLDSKTVFYNKLQCILAAQNSNSNDIRFYYNDHIFSKCNWVSEPNDTIVELYATRARQLRQKYDYIVLLYSGGSDSSNALKTFLNNDIKLDEVAYWYSSHNEASNLSNLEIIHAGSDMLHRLIAANITVSKLDMIPQLAKNIVPDLRWFCETEPGIILEQAVKPGLIYENYNWLKIRETGKSVSVITGLEKPRIYYENGTWYAGFLDVSNPYNFAKYHNYDCGITLEPFYISPDCPTVTIKQSHLVKNYINTHYDLQFIAQNFANDSNFNSELYFTCVRRACYPYWSDNTYSLGKDMPLLKEKNRWIWDSNSETSNTYMATLKQLQSSVDTYFLNNGDIYKGLVGSWSTRYCIGD
jgi:hypothetical protein